MLMQAERFGTPIARALSNFGDGIGQKRKQKAEEMAAKTTVKIIFPLVLFISPSLFIVLLGPAAIHIARGLTGIVLYRGECRVIGKPGIARILGRC